MLYWLYAKKKQHKSFIKRAVWHSFLGGQSLLFQQICLQHHHSSQGLKLTGQQVSPYSILQTRNRKH